MLMINCTLITFLSFLEGGEIQYFLIKDSNPWQWSLVIQEQVIASSNVLCTCTLPPAPSDCTQPNYYCACLFTIKVYRLYSSPEKVNEFCQCT
jgi:hypothetical protein